MNIENTENGKKTNYEYMKLLQLICCLLLMSGCKNSEKKIAQINYEEKELSFLHLRFGYDKSRNWIKQPENILMIHETFKKIGYQNLIDPEDWINDWNWYLDVKNSPKNLVDSLTLTYLSFQESPKYYREFWIRRKKENNDKIVYQVLTEIKQIMNEDSEIRIDQNTINDTLYQLISYEYPERRLSTKESNDMLNYLIEIGLHESAYNLVSRENTRFWNDEWKERRVEIVKSLNETEAYNRPWFEDDTK